MKTEEYLKKSPASVSFLPCQTGDGYGFGGGAVLTIGDRAIQFGEGFESGRLAEEVARRWNAALVRRSKETEMKLRQRLYQIRRSDAE